MYVYSRMTKISNSKLINIEGKDTEKKAIYEI